MSDILSKPIKPLIPRHPALDPSYGKTCIPREPSPAIGGNPCGEVTLRDLSPVEMMGVDLSRLETLKPSGHTWPFGTAENVSEPVKTAPAAPPVATPKPLEPIKPEKKVVELKAPGVPKLEPIKPEAPARKVVELKPPVPTLEVKPKVQPVAPAPVVAQPAPASTPSPVPAPVVARPATVAVWASDEPTPAPAVAQPAAIPGVAVWASDEEEFVPPAANAVAPVPVAAPVVTQPTVPAVPTLEPISKKVENKVEIPPLAVVPRDIYGYLIVGYDEDEMDTNIHGIYLPDELKRLPGPTVEDKLYTLCVSKFDSWTGEDALSVRKRNGHLTPRRSSVENGKAMNLLAKLEIVDNGSLYPGSGSDDDEAYVKYTFRAVRFKMNDLGSLKLNLIP